MIGATGRNYQRPRAPRGSPGLHSSHMMTDGEFEAFWYRLDARTQLHSEVYVEADDEEEAESLVVAILARTVDVPVTSVARGGKIAKGRTGRSARCGSCVACSTHDCGACKNCRDKPR